MWRRRRLYRRIGPSDARAQRAPALADPHGQSQQHPRRLADAARPDADAHARTKSVAERRAFDQPNRRTDARADPGTVSDTDDRSDGRTDSNADRRPNGRADAHAHTGADSDPHPDADACADASANPGANADADAHADSGANADSDSGADGDAHPGSDADANCGSDTHAGADTRWLDADVERTDARNDAVHL